MDDEKKYELVEQYLAGSLSDEARRHFEDQLKADPALQAEVELHEQVADTLRGEGVHQLRSTLQSVDQAWVLEKPGVGEGRRLRLPLRKAIILAASLLALVFAYYTFSPRTSLSPQDVYADNFSPYKMVLNQRSTTDAISEPETFSAAIAAYENKDFPQAATLFQNLHATHPDIIALLFYQAIADLSQNKTRAALSSLEKVLATPDHLFVEQSRWYLGLAYLQAQDLMKAKKVLEQIEEGAYKYKEAQQILQSI